MNNITHMQVNPCTVWAPFLHRQCAYAESPNCAITMLFLFIVLCTNMCVCVCARVCLFVRVCGGRACFCSFVFGPHCYWLDCSHAPIHPIATIATDGAAGINAPGSASLINGRLTKPLISDLFPSWLLTLVNFTTLQLPPTVPWMLTFCSSLSSLCWTPLYPCCQCMSSLVQKPVFWFCFPFLCYCLSCSTSISGKVPNDCRLAPHLVSATLQYKVLETLW